MILKAKKVYQYDLDGNYIGEYPSVNRATKETGINTANICRVANRSFDTKGTLRHIAGGYQWSYEKVDKMEKILTQSERAILKQEEKIERAVRREELKVKKAQLIAQEKAEQRWLRLQDREERLKLKRVY